MDLQELCQAVRGCRVAGFSGLVQSLGFGFLRKLDQYFVIG